VRNLVGAKLRDKKVLPQMRALFEDFYCSSGAR
jgi:hypothetical protein